MQPIRFEFVMDDTKVRESFERMAKAMRKEIDKNFDEQVRLYLGHWSAPDFTIHELDNMDFRPNTNRQYGPPVHDKKKNFRRQHRR